MRTLRKDSFAKTDSSSETTGYAYLLAASTDTTKNETTSEAVSTVKIGCSF